MYLLAPFATRVPRGQHAPLRSGSGCHVCASRPRGGRGRAFSRAAAPVRSHAGLSATSAVRRERLAPGGLGCRNAAASRVLPDCFAARAPCCNSRAGGRRRRHAVGVGCRRRGAQGSRLRQPTGQGRGADGGQRRRRRARGCAHRRSRAAARIWPLPARRRRQFRAPGRTAEEPRPAERWPCAAAHQRRRRLPRPGVWWRPLRRAGAGAGRARGERRSRRWPRL